MKELNDEIKLTLNLMQTDIDDGAHGELQYHMACLLEIKRNELQQRLTERSWLDHADGMGSVVKFDQAPYKSVKLDGQIEAKPLTVDELKAGGWWCADVSAECRLAFVDNGIDTRAAKLSSEEHCKYCYMAGSAIARSYTEHPKTKQIHRIGNDFYWSEK